MRPRARVPWRPAAPRARRRRSPLVLCLLLAVGSLVAGPGGAAARPPEAEPEVDLFALARRERSALAISTLFTAQNVRDLLSSSEGLDRAVAWCRRHGVTRVFIESFRDGYHADRAALERARDRFRAEGIEPCGCVTTTRVGKPSTGWKAISCFTDPGTRKKLASIFERAASLFDEIMIDDFFFTDCGCQECRRARGERSWASYRRELMDDVSRRDVLGAARRVNPRVRIILKYPQWYDLFHERGYDVVEQPPMFERIWVGTETRDPGSQRWGRKAQYEAYFIMRWLGGIGGAKCGGGWFDPYGTSPATYVEQARQTVLAGAREMLLFCYGSLLSEESRRDPEALRGEIPSLFRLARWRKGREPWGITAVKPPGSPPAAGEAYLFDFIGMLGLPLVPRSEIPERSDSLLVTSHLLADSGWKEAVEAHLEAGRPILATRGALGEARAARERVAARAGAGRKPGALVELEWEGDPRSLMDRPREELAKLRAPLLAPLGIAFDAPGRVALYLLGDDVVAIESFADAPVEVSLHSDRWKAWKSPERLVLPPGAEVAARLREGAFEGEIPARTLVVWRRRGTR